MTKDMTSGSPMNLLFHFTLPLIFGNLFQQLYSIVDAIVVGRFLGEKALAAVGSTGSLNFMIIGFCLGICSGFAIPIAQCFGAKQMEDLKRYVGNIIWLSVISAVVLTAVTVTFCRQILLAMNTPSDILESAYTFIVIIFAGIPATFFYNILASILRALGDSKTPVFCLVLSSVINIALDLLLIIVFPLGVAGAGIATVTAQLFSGFACLYFIRRRYAILRVSRDDVRPRGAYIKRLLAMGLPMGLQISITAIGSVILQVSVNALGSLAVAAMTAANKISCFFTCAYDALGVAMSTYGGQNVGARQKERLTPGLRAGLLIGVGYSILALLILILFGKPLASLFVSGSETEIISNAYECLVINAAFYIPLTGVNVFRLLIQGMGYSRVAVFAGVCEMTARALTGLFLVPVLGFTAACFASPIAWVLADCFLVPAYFHVLKQVSD
ncbi:MATE family efflux transporter [Caproicibacterium argilliputei]|uniref:MATE family efflux transporter n=1 Tax=Caproicibacterium argilliputei TaxID=3030016 RepID=A0AA97H0Q3_9FIRM|nr:MATE family efflux transporter [Caproicibacterium argilliputei]WOC31663.1 MATE family efflux transporter [Caproicibacterium argilliputei]